jgi:hypothetical protein
MSDELSRTARQNKQLAFSVPWLDNATDSSSQKAAVQNELAPEKTVSDLVLARQSDDFVRVLRVERERLLAEHLGKCKKDQKSQAKQSVQRSSAGKNAIAAYTNAQAHQANGKTTKQRSEKKPAHVLSRGDAGHHVLLVQVVQRADVDNLRHGTQERHWDHRVMADRESGCGDGVETRATRFTL